MTDIRFLGHACFELSDGEHRVLIDPFRLLDGAVAARAGFEYHALGMPPLLPC